MKDKIKIISINILILAICVIVIELFFGGWIFQKNNLDNLGLIKNVKLKYDLDGLYDDTKGYVYYTRDSYGLRGKNTYNLPHKIDILTVGGSTTDQRYVSDGKTWQDILEKLLNKTNKKYLVANAGIDGQSTFGHIKNFEIWFPQIKGLKPKYIMFYIGINDFYTLNQNSFDNLHIGKLSITEKIKKSIKDKSTFYNLYRKIKGSIVAENLGFGHYGVDFDKFKFTEKPIKNKQLYNLYDININKFRERLKILIKYTEKMGAKPIFVTQPTANFRIEGKKILGVEDTSYFKKMPFNGVDYYNLLQKFNEVIYNVCQNKYIVIELTNLDVWNTTDFYDWFHMTPSGEFKVGSQIFNQIKNKI